MTETKTQGYWLTDLFSLYEIEVRSGAWKKLEPFRVGTGIRKWQRHRLGERLGRRESVGRRTFQDRHGGCNRDLDANEANEYEEGRDEH